MKKKCDKILNPTFENVQTKLYFPIVDRFQKDSFIRDWTVSVISSLYQLEQGHSSSEESTSNQYFGLN